MKFQTSSCMLALSVASSVMAARTTTVTPQPPTTTVTPQECSTVYGSISYYPVPTNTATSTVEITRTKSTTVTVTTFTYTSFTYSSVVGKKSTTIPLKPDFTPLTSASTITSTFTIGKRSPEPVPSRPPPPMSFLNTVYCTVTATRTATVTKTVTTTETDGAYTAVTKTTTVPVSTAYAACAPTSKNVLDRFHGKPLGFPDSGPGGDGGIDACNDESIPASTRAIACLNARTCCEGAQKYGYAGFLFEDNPRGFHECAWFKGNFYFNNLVDYDNNLTYGNGAEGGKGVYVYYVVP